MKRIGESFIDGGGDTVATNRIETLKEENELLKKVDFDKLKAELRVLEGTLKIIGHWNLWRAC